MTKNKAGKDKFIIGITHGDVNSTNYKMIIDICSAGNITDIFTPVFYGTSKSVSYFKKLIRNFNFNFNIVRDISGISNNRANLFNITNEEITITIGEPSKAAGDAALLSLQKATESLKNNEIDALVATPLNRASMQLALDDKYTCHERLLTSYLDNNDYMVTWVYQDFRMTSATGKLPINQAIEKLTAELLESKIDMFINSLKIDFDIQKPKIAVLSLNPSYCKDNNCKEENEIIIPVINKFKSKGDLVFGPYNADKLFSDASYDEFDGIISMYYDQSYIPFSIFSQERGAIYLAGLPFVVTMPDSNAEMDFNSNNDNIAQSLRTAMYLANDISRNRQMWEEINENPLKYASQDIEQ